MAKGKPSRATSRPMQPKTSETKPAAILPVEWTTNFGDLLSRGIAVTIIVVLFIIGYRILSLVLLFVCLAVAAYMYIYFMGSPFSDVTESALDLLESKIDWSNILDLDDEDLSRLDTSVDQSLAAPPGEVSSGNKKHPTTTKSKPTKRKLQESDDDTEDDY